MSASVSTKLTMNSGFSSANSGATTKPSKVGLPHCANWPEVISRRPLCSISPSAGFHTNAPSMSPRFQAASAWFGDMLTMSTSSRGMLNCSSAKRRWKCVVEASGTAIVLPRRSCGEVIPDPSRTAKASAEAKTLST